MKAIGLILLIAGIALNVIIIAKINTGSMLSWLPASEAALWSIRIGLVVIGLVLMMASRKKA